MEFQQKDLLRVYREFAAGPQGIVLKVNERDNTIVFGKAFLYSLVAAPFVRVFGTSGFFVLHALLLWLNLLCAYKFCSRFMKPSTAVIFSIFYFLANASLVYLFWMTPEYFNMSLICYAIFFFVADESLPSNFKLFKSPYNYIIAAIFFAMATYSKPTNAALIAPLGIWMLYRKKVLPAMLTLSMFVLLTVGLFGINVYFTGQWNYQGGKRSVFNNNFPYGRAGASPFAPVQPEESQSKEGSVPLLFPRHFFTTGFISSSAVTAGWRSTFSRCFLFFCTIWWEKRIIFRPRCIFVGGSGFLHTWWEFPGTTLEVPERSATGIY